MSEQQQEEAPDKRLAEIRERWTYTASPVLPPPAQACADVAYLLSRLQQPDSERCGESILRSLCAEHPHIEFVEGVLGGVQPLINRHRVGVSHLLSRMAVGMPLEEYKETWGFDDETVKDAFAYAQDVIDALIDRERAVATTGAGAGEQRKLSEVDAERQAAAIVVVWRSIKDHNDKLLVQYIKNALIEATAPATVAEGQRGWANDPEHHCGLDCDATPVQPVAAAPDKRCRCGLEKDDPVHSFTTEWQQMHKYEPSTPTPGEGAREQLVQDIVQDVSTFFLDENAAYNLDTLPGIIRMHLSRFPPTEATQVAVEAAAREIAQRERDLFPNQLSVNGIVAIISKHCTADAGAIRASAIRLCANVARMMAIGENYETGRQKALNIAAALESLTKKEGDDGPL